MRTTNLWRVEAAADGFRGAVHRIDWRKRSEIVLRLSPLARVTGRIVDEASRPIEGAELRIASHGHVHDMTRSASDGSFEIEAVLEGAELRVEAAGYAWTVRRLEADATGALDLGEIVLETGERLVGRVLDSAGDSLPGASLYVWRGRHFRKFLGSPPRVDPDAVTDEEGEFELTSFLDNERIDLEVRADGHVPRLVEVAIEGDPLEIELAPTVQITGRVVDPGGAPIPRGRARWASLDIDGLSLSEAKAEIFNGRFAFEAIEGPPGRLVFEAPGFGARTLEIAEGAELEALEVVMEPAVTLLGEVLDPSGRAVEGARIQLLPEPPATRPEVTFFWATTKADGSFEMGGIAEGSRRFRFRHPDFPETVATVELVAPETRAEIILAHAERWSLGGRIVTLDGRGVAGQVDLRAADRDDRGFETRADDSGSFRFDSLPEGKYTLTAQSGDRFVIEPEEIDLRRDLEGLVLPVTRGSVVEGRLLGFDESILHRLELTLRRGEVVARAKIDREARTYRVERLRPGRWEIVLRLPSGDRSMGFVELPERAESVERRDLVAP